MKLTRRAFFATLAGATALGAAGKRVWAKVPVPGMFKFRGALVVVTPHADPRRIDYIVDPESEGWLYNLTIPEDMRQS